LNQPRPGAPLLLYLSVADEAISSALVQEEGKHQFPIYFTSHMLHDAEKCYQMIEKVALALITSARLLRPYFQSHQVVVKTNYPIMHVLRKLEPTGRMVARSIKLSEFDIQYEPRDPMKTQFMANILAEFAGNGTTNPDGWTLYIDGASNVKGSEAGIILKGPGNITLRASPQAQLQSLKQPGKVRGAHCRSKTSKRSRSQEATMLHRLAAS